MLSAGAADLALVVGFDKHPPGAFNPLPEDWGLGSWYGETGLMLTTQFFAMKIQRYMSEHQISVSTLAKVAAKAFRNGSANPNAWRRKPLTEQEILSAKMVNHPLTQFMFCSPGEGRSRSCWRAASGSRSPPARRCFSARWPSALGRFGSFEVFSPSIPIESAPSPTQEAAAAAFEQAGVGPEDIDIAQLQDTESGAEVMHLAETGLCQHGEQEGLIQSGATEIGGRLPINTDGGCLANGEPIGASGLRQIARGRATASRRGGRATGSRPAARGVHAGLRRTRRERVCGVEPLTSDCALPVLRHKRGCSHGLGRASSWCQRAFSVVAARQAS